MNWKNVALLTSVASTMIMSLHSTDYARAGLEEAPVEVAPELSRDRVQECGLNLLEAAGRAVDSEKVAALPALYRDASLNKEEEFMEYLLSIIYVESKFDRKAVSHMDARGLMQMTEIAVREAVLSCPSLRPLGDIAKLHDSHTNVKYGSCFLKKLHSDFQGDWTRILIVYNGGYAQLNRYNKGVEIASETANYVLKVQRVRSEVCHRERTSNYILTDSRTLDTLE